MFSPAGCRENKADVRDFFQQRHLRRCCGGEGGGKTCLEEGTSHLLSTQKHQMNHVHYAKDVH